MSKIAPFSKSRILLVEDNEDDFILVDAFLPRDEFVITWCSSARGARDRLSSESFDLVLLDHGLPDSNALSFLEEIRQSYPSCPVIVLTGRNDQALAISAKKMGASTYLLKDEIFDHLVPAIREVLDLSPRALGSSTATPLPDKVKFIDTADHFYEVLLETMNEGCLVVDTEGVITLVNRAVDRLVSCDADQLLGKNVRSIFASEATSELNQALRSLTETRGAQSSLITEARIARTYARVCDSDTTVRISMRSLHAADGRYEAGVMVLTDISELLRAKQMLSDLYQHEKSQHGQLRAIIDSSRDGILLVDQDLRILVINDAAVDLLLLPGSADAWTNRTLFEIMAVLRHSSPDMVRACLSEVRRIQGGDVLSKTGAVTIDTRVIHWMDLPVQADNSRLLVLQDVTAERSLQQMREDLVRTMVHDLRNPLGVISGALEYIKNLDSDCEPAEADWALDIALTGSHKMANLINAILDVSRLESGKMPIQQSVRSLTEIISRAVHNQLSLAANRGVHLHWAPGSDALLAWVDAGLIDRVLQNLLDNAIKFTPRGGRVGIRSGVYRSRAETSREMGVKQGLGWGRYYVSVTDSGPGVPLELKDRVFDKFVSGAKEGCGLGLAFCKLAIEAHGGRIWLQNKSASGATFLFTVPTAAPCETAPY